MTSLELFLVMIVTEDGKGESPRFSPKPRAKNLCLRYPQVARKYSSEMR